MKSADLYIRVSTDEQALKGYSPRSQEEVLRKHCETNNIAIRKVIHEDYSAKTFNRPEWKKLLENLRLNSSRPDYILFVKWDRFSRNAPDAYQMIATLKKLKVEPQAIEQPLDMSVPENKMMLAIYLTAPEIENDRRALNTFYGMRRARKEGRWTSLAPIGYINRSTPEGKKYIAPNDLQARIMKWAFHEIALEKYSTEQVFKRAKALGLGCNKNRFLQAIRNPVYCGRIFIETFKDEKSHVVKGLHDALISETLFYEVQDILNGNKRKIKTTIMSPKLLPLKGFIVCSQCTRTLCGSASRGRNHIYYYYYHCCSACGYRKKAEIVNELFIEELQKYVLRQESTDFFKTAIIDSFLQATQDEREGKTKYITEITELNNRITKGRELLLAGDIDGADYKTIKNDCEQKIVVLEAKLADIPLNIMTVSDVIEVLDRAIAKLTQIDVIYWQSEPDVQRQIIVSMFPEKFTFENLKARNIKVSFLYQLIYQINSMLGVKKRGASDRKTCLPTLAPEAGLEPATL